MTVRVTERGIVIEGRSAGAPATQPADTLGSITGSVVDSATGEAVAGATITVRDVSRSVASDTNGKFRITDLGAGEYTIVVRRLGYRQAAQRVVVAANVEATVRILLTPAPRVMDEVVTTATGAQRRREVGNLITTIAVDSIAASAPVTTLTQLLAGRAAGVQVLFTGGLTGVSAPISIRGQSSLSVNNEPLLVVDGARVDNSTVGPETGPTYAGLSSGRFNDLDPSEIESIEIVKGPSAATLYGTDAANGVIIVKTKRGKSGPPQWSAFASGGVLSFDRNRFPTSYYPWGHLSSGTMASTRCPLLSVAAGSCTQDSITSFSPLRDAETTPIGSGSRYDAGLQLRGGTAIRYLLSASMQSETGYLKMPSTDRVLLEAEAGRSLTNDELHPNGSRKFSVRTNLDLPATRTIDLGLSAVLNRSKLRIPVPTALLFGGGATGVRDQNDGWSFGQRAGDYLIKQADEHVQHLTASLNARWHPNDWLSGSVTTGLDMSTDYLDRLARAGLGFSQGAKRGSRENTKVDNTLQTIDLSVSADLPVATDFTSRTSIGAQYNKRLTLSNTAAASTLVPGAETVAGGAVPIVGESTIESVVAGTYLEEMVGWRDRVFVAGAVRVDGASSFGAGFRAAVYPKASLSWLLSEEPFWPRSSWVSSLRLRAAYGESGIQPGPVAALRAETLFPVVIGGGATATGARLGEVGNRELKPERQREFETGVDLALLKDRVSAQVTYYDKRSSDALVSMSLPASFGGGSQWRNVGAVRNSGFEFLVQTQLLTRSALSWDVTLSGSVNDNTVLAIAPSIDAIYRTGIGRTSMVRGYPIKSYFDYPIVGYADANGDGIITADEVAVGDEPAYAGGGYPRTQLSASTRVGLLHDRLTIAAVAERRSGYTIANIAEVIRCQFAACVGSTFRGESFEAQAANVARGSAALMNTFWGYFEDGSFTRLRELSLTYDLPSPLTRALRVSSASVTLSGRNLALWSAYSGTDPEVQTAPEMAEAAATYDDTGVPAPSYWLLKINFGF
jgi:TonB-linked SusC/RagA family outer membrane protein